LAPRSLSQVLAARSSSFGRARALHTKYSTNLLHRTRARCHAQPIGQTFTPNASFPAFLTVSLPQNAISTGSFLEACRLADARPNEVVHVGDDPAADVDGARGAGLRSVWYR